MKKLAPQEKSETVNQKNRQYTGQKQKNKKDKTLYTTYIYNNKKWFENCWSCHHTQRYLYQLILMSPEDISENLGEFHHSKNPTENGESRTHLGELH